MTVYFPGAKTRHLKPKFKPDPWHYNVMFTSILTKCHSITGAKLKKTPSTATKLDTNQSTIAETETKQKYTKTKIKSLNSSNKFCRSLNKRGDLYWLY